MKRNTDATVVRPREETGSPLSREEIVVLGIYNSEIARGLRHFPKWEVRMAELQARFDEHNLKQ